MKRAVLATMCLLILPTFGIAAEPSAKAPEVAPLVGEQTLVVARVDLTRLDVKASVKTLTEFLLANEATAALARSPFFAPGSPLRTQLLASAERVRSQFVEAGVKRVYLLWDLRMAFGRRQGFCLAVPLSDGADAAAIQKLLRQGFRMGPKSPPMPLLGYNAAFPKMARIGDLLVLGSERMIAHLQSRTPVRRKSLAAAFAATSDAEIQIAVLLSADVRRCLSEIIKRLPGHTDGRAGVVLADGVRWLSLGISLRNGLRVKWVAQAKDNDAAKSLRKLLTGVLKATADAAAPAEQVDRRILQLTPQRKGSQLTAAWAAKHIQLLVRHWFARPATRPASAGNAKKK